MIALAVSFFVALSVTIALTPPVIRLAERHGAVAVPRDRDVHEGNIPRWGGIAIYGGVLVATLLSVTLRHFRTGGENGWSWHLAGVLAAGTLIAAIGMLDDVKDLRPKWQILGILVAGLVLILFGVRIDGVGNPLAVTRPGSYDAAAWIPLGAPLGILLTLLWVGVVTKTVDALDGLDGLAAGVCAISSATLALLAAYSRQPEGPSLALLAASVTGACVGFLRFNYRPARVFMSTVGAQFLGFTLAAISILGTFKIAAAISVLIPILVLGVPIFDYAFVVLKRVLHRAPIMQADQRHLHHRLLARGLSHQQAVWVIYGCTAVLCAAAVVLFRVAR